MVQEYGDRVDGRIAAWGLVFGDRTAVVSLDGTLRMTLASPEQALRGFAVGSRISARLMWVGADSGAAAGQPR